METNNKAKLMLMFDITKKIGDIIKQQIINIDKEEKEEEKKEEEKEEGDINRKTKHRNYIGGGGKLLKKEEQVKKRFVMEWKDIKIEMKNKTYIFTEEMLTREAPNGLSGTMENSKKKKLEELTDEMGVTLEKFLKLEEAPTSNYSKCESAKGYVKLKNKKFFKLFVEELYKQNEIIAKNLWGYLYTVIIKLKKKYDNNELI